MIKKIVNFLRGFLLIEIRGNALARFINQIVAQGIFIWDLERKTNSKYLAKININDFNKLRPLLRKRKCWVKIKSKLGLPFFIAKLRQRCFLLLAFIIFFIIFYLASSFLLFINIQGLEHIPEEKINQILNNLDIKIGVFREHIDLIQLEKEILQEIPEIAWLDVKWQGTQLYLNIVEKKIIEKTEASDIIALKDGVITKLIVLQGQSLVKEGDTVTKNQPLIIGGSKGARGIVEGDVWYQAVVKQPHMSQEISYTGESKSSIALRLGPKLFSFNLGKIPFSLYQKQRKIKNIAKWRNFDFPIELIIERYIEIEYLENKFTPATALFLAKEKAIEKILGEIPQEAVINSIKIKEESLKDYEQVQVIVQTNECIAAYKK